MHDHSTAKPRYSMPRGGYTIPRRWKVNDYRLDGDSAYLLLRDRHGVPVGEAQIDAANLDRTLSVAHWTLFRSATPWLHYARGDSRGPARRRLYLHRFLMDAPPGTEVDHHNGNGLDCRLVNLRITDRVGNRNNRKQYRRERQLRDVVARLLACGHADPDCPCRVYARSVLAA